MNSNIRYTPDFCDALVKRLRAGEHPDDLRRELDIGSAMMTRYRQIAGGRSSV